MKERVIQLLSADTSFAENKDITYADSVGHEILALNEGSYIMLEDGKTTLYGEAYMIKDRQQRQICNDGESISL